MGGFVKTAQGGASEWLTPDLKNVLTNSAIGAGIGGAGGLGMGLFSKKKKNPLTTALSGAALGGVLGGALPALYEGVKGQTTAAPATGIDPQVAAAEANFNKQDAWSQFVGKIKGLTASANTSWPTVLKNLGGSAVGGTADYGWNAAKDNPKTLATHAGILGAQGLYHHNVTVPARNARDFTQGVHLLDKPPAGTTTPAPGAPGLTATRSAAGTPGISPNEAARNLAASMEPGMSSGIIRSRLNAVGAGHQLRGVTASGTRWHLPMAGQPSTATINEAIRRGGAQRRTAATAGGKIKGGGKGLLGLGMFLAPHALPYIADPIRRWAGG